MMITFSACPRCHGPVSKERDRWGAYSVCICCGVTIEPDDSSSKP